MVLKGSRHHVLQLLPQFVRQALEQRLHLRHLGGHLLDQLFQVLGRIGTEHIAMLLHEFIEIRLFTPNLLVHHLIQVRQHVFQALHILRRHIGHALGHFLKHVIHGLLLEHIHQFVKRLLCIGIKKFVFVQRLDPAGKIVGQFIQKLFSPLLVAPLLSRLSRLRTLASLPLLPPLSLLASRSLLSLLALITLLTVHAIGCGTVVAILAGCLIRRRLTLLI